MTMPPIRVDIFFNNSDLECKAGESLDGNVMLTVEKLLPVTEIQLQLLGKGNVSWSETDGTGDDAKTTWYYNKETYLDQHIMLFQSGGVVAPLGIGTFTFPFGIILSKDLPESFQSSVGNVTYKAKVRVKSKNNKIKYLKSSDKKKPDFTVRASVPIPIHLQELGTVEGTKNLPFCSDCCCCCSSGKISVKMVTDKGGYLAGEHISFKAEITNNSSSELENIKLFTKQEVVYIAKGGHTTKLIKKVGSNARFSGMLHGYDKVFWPLDIPLATTLPPTNLGNCKIMKVTYFLEIEIGENSGCCSPDVHFRIPFMLGSAAPATSSTTFQTLFVDSCPQVVTKQPLGSVPRT